MIKKLGSNPIELIEIWAERDHSSTYDLFILCLVLQFMVYFEVMTGSM